MGNSSIIMPELILNNSLKSIFDFFKKDYLEDSSQNKDKNYLYFFFKKDEFQTDMKFNTFDYFHEAVDLFVEKSVQINMGYNMEIADMPSVHILLPNETSRFLTIGGDENYQEPMIEIEEDILNSSSIEYTTPIFTQTFDSNYNIMITSKNMFEVLLIYNLLKTSFLSLYEHIELSGLRNVKLGGQDITIQSDLVPTHIFHRNLTLSFFYELDSPRNFKEQIIKHFTTAITN